MMADWKVGRKKPRSREKKKPGTEQQTAIVSKHRPSPLRCSYFLLSHHGESIQPQLGLFIFLRCRGKDILSKLLERTSLLFLFRPFLPPRGKADLRVAHLPFIYSRCKSVSLFHGGKCVLTSNDDTRDFAKYWQIYRRIYQEAYCY